MKMIIGLGNPGPEYALTRHNIGFLCLDNISKSLNFQEQFTQDKKHHALLLKNKEIILAKPQTFMNLSGGAVMALSTYYKIPPKDIYIIHDEVDLEFGRIKIQKDGGSAGHNGVKSVIESLGTQEFVRWRVGVGKPSKDLHIETAEYVLQNFSKDEQQELNSIYEIIAHSIEHALTNDIIATMNKYN